MFRSLSVAAAGLALVSCSNPNTAQEAPKKQTGVTPSEIQAMDFKCNLAENHLADAYANVNRISIDLVNNRIDVFSKDKVWNFHSIQQNDRDRHELHFAFVGKNIAAWGIDRQQPYNFFFDTTNSTILFSMIDAGKVQWAQFNC